MMPRSHIRKLLSCLPITLLLFAVLLHPLIAATPAVAAVSQAQTQEEAATEKPKPAPSVPPGPVDEFNRGTPRGTIK